MAAALQRVTRNLLSHAEENVWFNTGPGALTKLTADLIASGSNALTRDITVWHRHRFLPYIQMHVPLGYKRMAGYWNGQSHKLQILPLLEGIKAKKAPKANFGCRKIILQSGRWACPLTDILSIDGTDLYTLHHRNTIAKLSRDSALGFNCASAYLLASCALKLGLDVTFFRTQRAAQCEIRTFLPRFDRPSFFRISRKGRKAFIWGSASKSSVSISGARLCTSKSLSKARFQAMGVDTPSGGFATSKDLSILEK